MRKLSLFLLPLFIAACTKEPDAPPENGEAPPKVSNRIDVPKSVRDNLGITFVKVERRFVAQTLRVPGRFESMPEAINEQRAAMAGRVSLYVKQFQQVEAHALLFGIDAPEWRRVQQEISDAHARVQTTQAGVAVRKSLIDEARTDAELVLSRTESIVAVEKASLEHSAELESGAAVWATRIAELEKLRESGAGKAGDLIEARSQLADARSKLAEQREKRAELNLQRREIEVEAARVKNSFSRLAQELSAAQAEADAAGSALQMKLSLAAAMTGLTSGELIKAENGVEHWRAISGIEVRATAPGIVSTLDVNSGGWVEQGSLVMSLQDPAKTRVRARVLQADLTRLNEGQVTRILPPGGGNLALETPVEGRLAFSLSADADERVIEVIVTPTASASWARPGIAVEVEITLTTTQQPELAIPLACVVRDELHRIFFRRDPNDENKVIRIEGEFGIDDGRWIVVKASVMDGDQIVLGGVYELKLSGSGKPTGAGHFHADGTFHTGKH